jgi:hypothetical protein
MQVTPVLQALRNMSTIDVFEHKAHYAQFLSYTDWLDFDEFRSDGDLAWAIYYYTLGDCDREPASNDVAVRALRWRQPPRPDNAWLFMIEGTWCTMYEARQWLVKFYVNHTDMWQLQDGALDDRPDLLYYS